MKKLMDAVLKRFVVIGTFRVRWPDGTTSIYSGAPGPEATLSVHNWAVVRRVLLDPELAVGEGYMSGELEPVGCDIYTVLDVLLSNMMSKDSVQPVWKLQQLRARLTRRFAQWNTPFRSRRNVAQHYDIDGRVYALFLDMDRQYSCAYFPSGDETLEQAQAAKKRHIAGKLLLDRPGLEVLDIGSGWGGMAITLARDYGAIVTGVTLSTEQLEASMARAQAEGLSDRVTFELRDYRSLERSFDRVVSVGMFEHVGVVHYSQFFRTLSRVMKPDGVALLHSIGRSHGPGSTDAWFRKYIFPGGYAPALSEVLPKVERSGLVVTDIEIWRLHYARTLRQWRARFAANRAAIAELHDERFCRMFEFYFAGSELAFRRTGQMVFQMQLSRDLTTVPLTRNYMYAG